jgi:hypothetical protein
VSDTFDKFGDVIQGSEGIFAGGMGSIDDGLKKFDSASHQMRADGVLVEMQCRGCGRPKHMLVEWPEIIAIRCGVSPHQAYGNIGELARFASSWRPAQAQSEPHWVPDGATCNRCGTPVQPMFSVAECYRLIAKAKSQGLLRESDEVQLGQICTRVAQMMQMR